MYPTLRVILSLLAGSIAVPATYFFADDVGLAAFAEPMISNLRNKEIFLAIWFGLAVTAVCFYLSPLVQYLFPPSTAGAGQASATNRGAESKSSKTRVVTAPVRSQGAGQGGIARQEDRRAQAPKALVFGSQGAAVSYEYRDVGDEGDIEVVITAHNLSGREFKEILRVKVQNLTAVKWQSNNLPEARTRTLVAVIKAVKKKSVLATLQGLCPA